MKRQKLLFALTFSGMFMMGYIDSLRGPLIPWIRKSFNISYSSVGAIFFVAGLGFLIATFSGGMLCDRIGQKKVMFFGFLCTISAIAGISLSPLFGIFLFMMGFLNVGLGSVEIGINSLVSGIEVKNRAVIMNLLHFFYGVGATIGPRYSGQMLTSGFDWRRTYMFSLMVIISVFIYFIFVKFPGIEKRGHQESMPLSVILKNKRVLLFGTALGVYVASELGVTNWFVNYLTIVYKMNELKSATYLSAFFIMFTAGRLVGGFIAEKLGYFRSVLIFMISSLCLFVGGISLGEKYVILVSACGLAYSIVFPTIVSAVINEFRKSTGAVLGVVITMSSGISMVLNWFIGKLNDMVDVKFGFMSITVYIIVVIILVSFLYQGKSGNAKMEEAV